MLTSPKSRKRDKFRGLFSRSKSPQPDIQHSNQTAKSTTPPDRSAQGDAPINQRFDDTQRTKERYIEAIEKLQKAVNKQKRGGPWNSGEFDSITGEPASFNDLDFRMKLDRVLAIKKSKNGDDILWERGKSIVRYLYHTLAPFAKCFLTIAKEGAAVSP
jgi:hypothetical protein